MRRWRAAGLSVASVLCVIKVIKMATIEKAEELQLPAALRRLGHEGPGLYMAVAGFVIFVIFLNVLIRKRFMTTHR